METGNRKTRKSVPSAKKGRTAAPVTVIDWVGVERAYCGTRQSTRDIGKAFGISHTMVAKHAAAKGWARPSKDQIPNPPPRKGTTELEPRQERFVQEYLIDLNGTQAYMRAEPGTTEKSARTQASRMLAKVNVQKRIAAERSKTATKLELTCERVLAGYTKLAFFDMRQAYHDSGALKLPHELDEDTAAAIAGYETVEMDGGGTYDVEITEQPMQVTFQNSHFQQALEMRKAGVRINDATMVRYSNLSDKSTVVQHDRALQARRSALVKQFAMAAMAGDEEGKSEAREAIASFNEKNPNRRIQAIQLAQSVHQREKRIRGAKEGVYLPSKRRDSMEAGRFANEQ